MASATFDISALNLVEGRDGFFTVEAEGTYETLSVSLLVANGLGAADFSLRQVSSATVETNGYKRESANYSYSALADGLAEGTERAQLQVTLDGQVYDTIALSITDNRPATGAVGIAGTAAQGQLLQAQNQSLGDPEGLQSIAWSWTRDGAVIAGAQGQSYRLTQADVGKAIAARATITDNLGETSTVTSDPTRDVTNVNDSPRGAVTIQGNAAIDETLKADLSGLSDADGLGTPRYQWLADGEAIAGATAATLLLDETLVSSRISLQVAYTDGYGTQENVTSAATAAVAAGLTLTGTPQADRLQGGNGGDVISGLAGNDQLFGGNGDDRLYGGGGDDRLLGEAGDDRLEGGDGRDMLNGGDGDDMIFGGSSAADLRDVIYGGAGNDVIDAGYGNDLIMGGAGADSMAGGYGADTVIGNEGADILTGAAFGDLLYGGDGFDFLNGGFGSDRLNGGAGPDRFYHAGVAGHGNDWIQDYAATDGDRLVWGGDPAATAEQFQINLAQTANAGGAAQEAFVIYKPTGQIIWALVDGGAQQDIRLQIGADVFDLA
ncbi:hypothetical protein [Pseudoroseicyclus aestuarii]|uniref:Hemolysin type calcium-binding protein n=1 Tax=Pseudoroseicyclus aestuarii TaxID=1795041 RepID=A0A318T7M8_9RHOB|nr:hypothetical protein [Pseudoroseicyclus aestuarii]PYE84398.1 hemolysin type calcium-binding protein [Pseudoroseicyclus aestuarii]